jgi:hypothetical protein
LQEGEGHEITITQVKSFIKENKVKKTDFHYRIIMQMQDDDRSAYHTCILCQNWMLYHCKTRDKHKKKVLKMFTPLDHVILHTLEPGKIQEPDHRCFKRIASVVSNPNNFFADIIPFATKRILEASRGFGGEELPEKIALNWWKYNNETIFFQCKYTSKRVRRAVRQNARRLQAEYKPFMRWRH